MGKLFNDIRVAARQERYVVGVHANQRLRERKIAGWQIVLGLEDGILLAERYDALPHPVAEVSTALADGTQVKAIWAWLAQSKTAKLVTVHFFDFQS